MIKELRASRKARLELRRDPYFHANRDHSIRHRPVVATDVLVAVVLHRLLQTISSRCCMNIMHWHALAMA
jgi:hypothetical protein